jgi:hypothetical protein
MDVDEAQVPHTVKLHMSLPMRHGSMGLIKLTPEGLLASYLAYAGHNARGAACGGAAAADL